MPPPAPEPLRALDSELELGERLGSGAMGSVYRARERGSGREVALKILHAETSSAATRFFREGQVTAGLKHPGIVRVHSIGTMSGRPCLAYELVAGARSFDEAIEADPNLAMSLLIQAGQALGAAHAMGLTHRDVKSENLLVDAEGRLRVTDFGLVTGEELSRLTQSGAWVGTPMAMAPEQFGAREQIGPGTDVWALGVLLYRALTGVYPFEGAESMISLASAITGGNFVRPSRVRPTPAALEAVCLKAMSPRPGDRHAGGAAFSAALESALQAKAPRSRGALLALLGVGCVGVLAVGASFVATAEPETAATPSQPLPPASIAPPSESPRALEGDLLLAIRAWRFDELPSRLPDALLEEDLYSEPSTDFRHIMGALKKTNGATTQLRAARSLLSGNGVRRDTETALEILRHAAKGKNRAALALLLDTLAEGGHREEELVWLGRLALNEPHPLELHRLWRIARASDDPRSPLARRLWAEIKAAELRASVLNFLEGRRSRHTDAPRAEREERRQFLIEAALRGWSADESLSSDWQLGVTLDLLPPEVRYRLIRLGSPSRRLARLCLRREGKLREHLRPEDSRLLELALRPTLTEADEAWLIEVTKSLLQGGAEPPCLAEFLERLRALPTPAAKRWVAVCRARGFGGPPSQEGTQRLQELQRGGDHEAGVMLVTGSRTKLSPQLLQQLLGPGVKTGHPRSMFHLASSHLQSEPPGPATQSYVSLLQRAAEAGDAPAQALIAQIIDRSISKPEHPEQALSWLEKAARQDHPGSIRRLAVLQEAGFGCKKDPQAALETLRRGTYLGDRAAALRLGQLLLRAPEGEDEDAATERRVRARRYLRRALIQGAGSGAELALVHHDLADPARRKTSHSALEALAKRNPTNASIQGELGKRLLERGRARRGEELLRRCAPASRTALNVYLGHLRAEGRAEEARRFLEEGVRTELPHYMILAAEELSSTRPQESDTLLRRAAELGRPQALVNLGLLLWKTERAEARREAWKLWLMAHRVGNVSATNALGAHEWPE